ncbi:MAG: 3'(2'),5'-bisphosphate nucleotidase CysQ [Cyclobacteriaceae bacterium]
MQDSKGRSLAKGVSWRVIASLTTLVLAYIFIDKDHVTDLKYIVLLEVIGKLLFYYGHERIWNFVPWGRTSKGPSYARSVVKGIIWRGIATGTSALLFYIFTGDGMVALEFGAVELLIKLAVYYFHERFWGNIKWGRMKGNVNPTLNNMDLIEKLDIEKINEIAKKAGIKILDIYENTDFEKTVDFKADDSPLTIADKEAHLIIEAELEKLNLGIPILSEEGRIATYQERQKWEYFWCVDPLDGTKEFIKKNGEFTVNIALIKDGKPVMGVIYAPVLDTMYYGDTNGAFKEINGTKEELKSQYRDSNKVAVKSKSHASSEEDAVFKKHGVTEEISVGSSLKFCMVAEGKADIYYRHGPTMEWDTAAGQAIAEASGATMFDADMNPFSYNKEVLRNGSFTCIGKKR